MDISKPFLHCGFKAWYTDVVANGGQLSIVVNFGESKTFQIGDPETGINMFDRIIKSKKRKSMDWLGDPSCLKKLRVAISDMKPNDSLVEAPLVLRHFIGEKAQYGVGDCFFWEHRVSLETLKYSLPVLKKISFNNDTVALSDFIW